MPAPGPNPRLQVLPASRRPEPPRATLARLLETTRRWWRAQQAAERLTALDDRMLRDIGFTRESLREDAEAAIRRR